MKKTTMQDVADAIGVSRVTVWKVFSHHEGVSEDLQNKIITKAIELGYRLPDDLRPNSAAPRTNDAGHVQNSVSVSTPAAPARQYTISVTVSRPETSAFWMNIIHEIAKEASRYNINLMYTYLPYDADENYEIPPVLTNGTVQGMIVMNVYSESLIRKLCALPLPKVFMDTATKLPFRTISGDLVLIEGRSCISEIVDSIVARGKTRFSFIGDINYAQTNYERYHGFVHSLTEHGLPIKEEYLMTGPIGSDTYREEICEFLDGLKKLPEAFICVSDFVASLLRKELNARGMRVPEDVVVSGFDGNTEFAGTDDLTTVQVHTSEIGLRLVHQLIYRIEHPDACHEICYLCSDVIFRHSTDC